MHALRPRAAALQPTSLNPPAGARLWQHLVATSQCVLNSYHVCPDLFSSCVYSASVAVCQCMSQTLHYPRDLVLGLEQGQHFYGILHNSIPTTTFNSTELRDAATIILISIAPAHVGFGPRATHFEELVHLGLHHPVYCALI